MRLRVRYTRPFDLVADHDQQMTRGGLLVRVAPPPELTLYAAVELELVLPDGASLVRPGQVVQLVGGAGVAIAFAVDPAITRAVEAARAAPARDGAPPVHELVRAGGSEPAPPPRAEPDAARDPRARLAAASPTEKIQIALHGNKDERALIMRDNNRMLHSYVLRNPNLTLDEVTAIAKMATVAPELLKAIADRREWAQRPEVAIALVRNPKTPTPIAVKLLDYVAPAELRQLAKDTRTRPPIQAAARKKVVN